MPPALLPRRFDRRQMLGGALVGLTGPTTAAPASKPWLADVIDITPWGRVGTDREPAGLYAQLLRELARRSGCPLRLRVVPISRSVADVSSGYSQLTLMLERADLNQNAVLLGPVTNLSIVIWLPAGSRMRSLNDLVGRTVATLRGPAYHEAFDAEARIRKQPVNGPGQQLQVLRAGRVDGAIGVHENFLAAAQELGLRPADFGEPIRLGLRRVLAWTSRAVQTDPCFPQLQKALGDLRQSQWLDRQIAAQLGA